MATDKNGAPKPPAKYSPQKPKPLPEKKDALVQLNPKFLSMLQAYAKAGLTTMDVLNRVIVGIDPGETTGMCIYLPWQQNILHIKQIPTKSIVNGYLAIKKELPQTDHPIHMVCEDYRVYQHKLESHAWAGLHTPQLIGAIKIIAHEQNAILSTPMAVEAKSWATDENLKEWGIYEPGLKHGRDAERHVMKYMFFAGSGQLL
jgi:hypothetical protein